MRHCCTDKRAYVRKDSTWRRTGPCFSPTRPCPIYGSPVSSLLPVCALIVDFQNVLSPKAVQFVTCTHHFRASPHSIAAEYFL